MRFIILRAKIVGAKVVKVLFWLRRTHSLEHERIQFAQFIIVFYLFIKVGCFISPNWTFLLQTLPSFNWTFLLQTLSSFEQRRYYFFVVIFSFCILGLTILAFFVNHFIFIICSEEIKIASKRFRFKVLYGILLIFDSLNLYRFGLNRLILLWLLNFIPCLFRKIVDYLL